ncbi:hypothetical protein [Glycomyces salinus]|uniref:hypothetical protein n=1 Tax=Glycomyces salinus TaxID=980294 RepID=UPI0018ECB8DB|nr:hypothetical protein [Glycomyces salinus]
MDELSGQIEALKGEIDQTAASAGASMSSAEELSNQTQALGMESKAAEAMAVKDALGQLQTGLQAIGEQAEGVRAQVEAMRTLQGGTGGGVSAEGEQDNAPTPAGGSGGGQGPNEPPTGGPPAPGAPESEENPSSELSFRTGDQVESWEAAPESQQVINLEDEDDDFEKLLRRADDAKDSVKTTTESAMNVAKLMREPGPTEAHTYTAETIYTAPPEPQTNVPDIVSSASMTVLMTAYGIREAVRRWRGRET